ncbi:hypothetical protein C9J27_04315 [Photobacterium kishitanii]|uniref:Uncharacterized protein n=1 Tax=Photobacterium kishitanii TaxID=318456 RepID=A0A2T3KL35_9GAMM|nr:hypothetical protein C9J27_04315 [Photobacterium kishitanii]
MKMNVGACPDYETHNTTTTPKDNKILVLNKLNRSTATTTEPPKKSPLSLGGSVMAILYLLVALLLESE